MSPLGTAKARLIILGLMVLLAYGVWRPTPRHGANAPDTRTDSDLYSTVIRRVAQGEGYYASLGSELRERGYPTASVFNWRLPTLTLMLAWTPTAAKALLALLVVSVLAGTVLLFRRAAPAVTIVAVLMQVGASASAFNPLATVLPETWAGLCIALSALIYASGRVMPAAMLAVAACYLRELAALYALVCALVALRLGRRRELLVFAIGGIIGLAYFGGHAAAATASMTDDALQHPSWIQWGGPRFVLTTIGFGGWLYLLPPWAAAIAAVLLVACIWSPLRATHVQAAALAYPVAFMVVGQPFNQYWGWLVAPLWALAYGLGAAGLLRLVQTARGTSNAPAVRVG